MVAYKACNKRAFLKSLLLAVRFEAVELFWLEDDRYLSFPSVCYILTHSAYLYRTSTYLSILLRSLRLEEPPDFP